MMTPLSLFLFLLFAFLDFLIQTHLVVVVCFSVYTIVYIFCHLFLVIIFMQLQQKQMEEIFKFLQLLRHSLYKVSHYRMQFQKVPCGVQKDVCYLDGMFCRYSSVHFTHNAIEHRQFSVLFWIYILVRGECRSQILELC